MGGQEERALCGVGPYARLQELAYGCLVGLFFIIINWPLPKVGFSVPVSKLPELVYETKKEIEEAGLLGIVCGHVGDGKFHPGSQLSPKPC